MKTYRTPLIVGLVLALLLGTAALAGYGVVLYYNWLILLFVLLLLAAPTVKRQPSAVAYLCAVVILVAYGHGGR